MNATCDICPHGCVIEENGVGFCGARKNIDGIIKCVNYGHITSLALDPIEKKPLRRFMPGSRILSAGSYGCNLCCPFCQNHEISMPRGDVRYTEIRPLELAGRVFELRSKGNIGVAYTYNEPLISYEFVRDCGKLIHERGMKNVLVTNGFINEKPLTELLPRIDAMNIDLKGYTEAFYKSLGGSLADVRRTISLAARCCHVEVTYLVIPGENDDEDSFREMAEWLSSLGDIPLHISRFFPRYRYGGKSATPGETVLRLLDIARGYLRHVYTGNM